MKLKEICSFQSGGTPSKSNPAYFNGTIPWITTVALNGKTINETDAVEWITEQAVSESAAKIVPAYSIMVGTRVGVGKTAINTFPMSTSQDIISLIGIDESKWDKGFINKLIQSKSVYLNSQARGATIKGIKIDVLADLSIPDLPKDKQKEIVTILDNAQCVISKRQHELRSLDNLIKARFVEMFGEPVSNEKGWRTESMNNVAPAVNSTSKTEGNVWLLNLDMVEAQTGRIIDYLIVPTSEIGNSTCAFDTSNVLYSKLRPYLNKVVIPDRCGYATSELVPLQPVCSIMNREYFAFMLRSNEFVKMISDKVAGAKMPRVSMSDFRNFDVPIPPIDLQNQFAAFVAQVDKSKFVVQKALDKAQLLFDSLMQKHFG